MSFLSEFVSQLPMFLLRLPVVLFALSFHEAAHGFVAYKLGDPTARSLGRLTLNPAKHLDPLGFLSMVLFRIGWAKPVPINTRYFKKPKRDMALCGAAGPLSNLALAIVFLIVLRLVMIPVSAAYPNGVVENPDFAYMCVALSVYVLYAGFELNICLAIFNLIPLPPFDGSRIFYAFLPTKLYFGVMKYERIIMIVVMALFLFGILDVPLSLIMNGVEIGSFFATAMPFKVLYSMTNFVRFGLMPINFG